MRAALEREDTVNDNAIPDYAHSRGLQVLGYTWAATLSVDYRAVRLLFSRVDMQRLASLHRHQPDSLAFEILAGEDIWSLWLGPDRLAAIKAPK